MTERQSDRLHITDDALCAELRASYSDDEKFRVVERLVRVAGHIRIRDLYALTSADVSTEVYEAIREAQTLGMRVVPNNLCCDHYGGVPDRCVPDPGKYCKVITGGTDGDPRQVCTLASDECALTTTTTSTTTTTTTTTTTSRRDGW